MGPKDDLATTSVPEVEGDHFATIVETIPLVAPTFLQVPSQTP